MFLFEESQLPKLKSPHLATPLPKAAKVEEMPMEKVEDGILHGTFPFKDGWWGKETVVGYLVPLDSAGKPLSGSEQMIFYAPFTGEQERIPGTQAWLRKLAKESGCTVYTMRIQASASESDNRKAYFIYPESGWHDMVFKVQAAVAKKLGFRPGRLMLAGESSGGSMAQQLCAANPEKIAAAAWIGGSRYAEQIDENDRIPRLILSTWGCPGEAASKRYAEELRQRGVVAFDLRTPPNFKLENPDHHAPSTIAYELITSYLAGVAASRVANNGNQPPPAMWQAKSEDGLPVPSREFAVLYDSLGKDPVNPVCLAVVAGKSDDPLFRDFPHLLRQEGAVVVLMAVGDNLLKERMLCEERLAKLLQDGRYRTLPLFLVGVGGAGQPAAVAALRLGNSRIRQIVLFDTLPDSPFEELSITGSLRESSVPVLLYGASGEVPGITTRPLLKRGNHEYAEKIREALQQ